MKRLAESSQVRFRSTLEPLERSPRVITARIHAWTLLELSYSLSLAPERRYT